MALFRCFLAERSAGIPVLSHVYSLHTLASDHMYDQKIPHVPRFPIVRPVFRSKEGRGSEGEDRATVISATNPKSGRTRFAEGTLTEDQAHGYTPCHYMHEYLSHVSNV